MTIPIAVLASGGGTNLQALIDDPSLAAAGRVALVISDRADAGALQRARKHGIAALHIEVRGRPVVEVADDTLQALQQHDIAFIALAGYLRLVPAPVIAGFSGRIVNIHPALLPAFGGRGMYGLHVHRAVIAAGCRVTGATVHRVTEQYDEGSILAQWPVPVLPGDTPEALAQRVLAVEHVLYPATIRAMLAQAGGSGVPAALPHTFRLRTAGPDDDLSAEILRLAGY